ncbi:MAG: hypothetical protein WCL06_12275 [Bacteroidota bacterium]
MTKRIACLILLMTFVWASALGQKYRINKDDFNSTVQQLTSVMPGDWRVLTDTAQPNEIRIQSGIVDLQPDMNSNDPAYGVEGQCEIYILMLPLLSPDSIDIIRSRNQKLRESLPPQQSKDNLKNWYTKNAKTLKILDSEPTNYDDKYSYRIKCQRVPKTEGDKKQYDAIRAELDKLFKKYEDNK